MFLLNEPESLDDFIKRYDHINYCEIIVLEDGEIIEVRPSHVETLRMIYEKKHGLNEKESWDIIPMSASPVEWHVNELGVVSSWYDGAIFPNDGVTEAQFDAFKALNEAGKVSFDISTKSNIKK
ncbi:hypothetical protein [Enterococcus sp. AZ180]|uniref:hypothetical protein n=1 Tax=Enterococcus sp. AZ180 TaxID=2774961 RepID=UPI003F214502